MTLPVVESKIQTNLSAVAGYIVPGKLCLGCMGVIVNGCYSMGSGRGHSQGDACCTFTGHMAMQYGAWCGASDCL